MRIDHVLWLLLLSQCAAADVFLIKVSDTSSGDMINLSGGSRGCCILHAPKPGLQYLDFGVRSTPVNYILAEPGDDNIAAIFSFWPNSPITGAETEIYLPESFDPYPGQFVDLTAYGGCSSDPACTPGTQNGTEYYLGAITYTDGETDSFYFEWIVSGLPVVAPEPTSLVFLATVTAAMITFRCCRASSGINKSTRESGRGPGLR